MHTYVNTRTSGRHVVLCVYMRTGSCISTCSCMCECVLCVLSVCGGEGGGGGSLGGRAVYLHCRHRSRPAIFGQLLTDNCTIAWRSHVAHTDVSCLYTYICIYIYTVTYICRNVSSHRTYVEMSHVIYTLTYICECVYDTYIETLLHINYIYMSYTHSHIHVVMYHVPTRHITHVKSATSHVWK